MNRNTFVGLVISVACGLVYPLSSGRARDVVVAFAMVSLMVLIVLWARSYLQQRQRQQ